MHHQVPAGNQGVYKVGRQRHCYIMNASESDTHTQHTVMCSLELFSNSYSHETLTLYQAM